MRGTAFRSLVCVLLGEYYSLNLIGVLAFIQSMYMYVPVYSCGVQFFFSKNCCKRSSPIADPSASSLRSARAYGAVARVSVTRSGRLRTASALCDAARRRPGGRLRRVVGPRALHGLRAGHERAAPHLESCQEGREPPRHAPDLILAADALVDRRHRHAVAEHAGAAVAAVVPGRLLGIDRALNSGRHGRRLGADVSRVITIILSRRPIVLSTFLSSGYKFI